MRVGLKSRIARLERQKKQRGPGANRILRYRAEEPHSALSVEGCGALSPVVKNCSTGRSEVLPGRYMLIPYFSSLDEWEKVALAHQAKLLEVAESRH